MRVYTVGHSNHSIDGLVALLRGCGVARVVDVRSVPYSKYWTQFRKQHLRAGLGERRVDYRWMGDRLGGKIDCAYAERATQPDFIAAIDELLELAREQPTALLCAEKDPRDCHRRKLLTPALAGRGVTVVHILADGSMHPDDELDPDDPQLALF